MKGGLSLAAQQANRLYLAHLKEALNYLRALSELDDLPTEKRSTFHGDITDAVFVATIVVYCRSFVDSAAEGMASPNLSFSVQGQARRSAGSSAGARHAPASHSTFGLAVPRRPASRS